MGRLRASRLRMFCKAIGLTVSTLASLSGASAQVYNQPYTGASQPLASQNDPVTLGNFATAYDNFVLAGSTTLTRLTFTGAYFNPATVGATTGFEIQIYGNNGGLPGTSLWSSVVAGNGGESCNSSGAFPVCSYSVPVNFAASSGTQYWLSIVSDSVFPPQWSWASSSGGSSYRQFVGMSPGFVDGNRAFALFDTSEVPEPSSWAMMLIGFGVAGTAMRRRRCMRPAPTS